MKEHELGIESALIKQNEITEEVMDIKPTTALGNLLHLAGQQVRGGICISCSCNAAMKDVLHNSLQAHICIAGHTIADCLTGMLYPQLPAALPSSLLPVALPCIEVIFADALDKL